MLLQMALFRSFLWLIENGAIFFTFNLKEIMPSKTSLLENSVRPQKELKPM